VKPVEKDEGLQVGFHNNNSVQEWALHRPSDRGRLIQAGNAANTSDLTETLDGKTEMGQAITNIGAESNGVPGHRLLSMVTDTSSTAASIGASGL
jgi:hypothetical protein